MRAVVQRVANSSVTVEGTTTGAIEQGFLILLGVAVEDTEKEAEKLSAKIAGLRVFTDAQDKMNLSLQDIGGAVLVVSNFTLCADYRTGRRPFFGGAARPEKAEPLYERVVAQLRAQLGARRASSGRI